MPCRCSFSRLACLLTACTVCLATAAPAFCLDTAQTLTLYAFNRPPYYEFGENETSGGFLLEIAKAVLSRAGIPFRVENMPAKRILLTLTAGKSYACSPGWLKTPEREAQVRFSAPLYVNRPLGAVVNAAVAKGLPEAPTLQALLASGLALGLEDGFSYGNDIDAKLKEHPGAFSRPASSTVALVAMVARGRLDYALIEPEEMSWLYIRDQGLKGKARFVPLADAPPGNARYLMCGRAVTQPALERINEAIREFRASERYARLTSFPLDQ